MSVGLGEGKSLAKSSKNKGLKGVPKNTKLSPRKGKNQALVAPVAKQKRVSTSKPRVTTRGDNFYVKHREFLADIEGNSAFTISKWELNPGLPTTFPWLSGVASRFESYIVHKMRVIYEPTVSTNTNGTILMGVDFDAADESPEDKVKMMAMKGSVRSAPWASCSKTLSKSDIHTMAKQKYIRVTSLDPNLDIKTYDVGSLYIATQGFSSATDTGELYIEYEIELKTPQLLNDDSLLSSVEYFYDTGGSDIPYPTLLVNLNRIAGALPVENQRYTPKIPGIYEYVFDFKRSAALAGSNWYSSFSALQAAFTSAGYQVLQASTSTPNSATTLNYSTQRIVVKKPDNVSTPDFSGVYQIAALSLLIRKMSGQNYYL